MKKLRLFSALLVLVMLLSVLAGCACKHEWTDANCKAPKTCNLCGETEGEKTEDHKWEDATTEAPKTCSVCGKTEGEKINTDPRFKTAACKDLFGTWTGTVSMSAQEMGLTGTGNVAITITYTFSNDGKMSCAMKMDDLDGYAQLMIDMMYDTYAAMGMSKAEAQNAVKQTYGMTVEEYCQDAAETVADSFNATTVTMVYYVEAGKVYSALKWDDEMTGSEFSFNNGVLHLVDDGKPVDLTKVEK